MIRLRTPAARSAFQEAIDTAISYGTRRAFKYDDAPNEEAIISQVEIAVSDVLAEWIAWDDEKND